MDTPMEAFVVGHATHPDWRGALALVTAQVQAQLTKRAGAEPTLGLVYFTDAYVGDAAALMVALRAQWPGVAFAGTVGVGVAASGVEYFQEPGLVLMLAALPRSQFQVFSGQRRLELPSPQAALVHADPGTADLAELLVELAARMKTGLLFGGVAASRSGHVLLAEGAFTGGLAGVAFGAGVPLISRVTQGCQPVGPARRVTASDGPLVTALDGEPALPMLLADLGLSDLGNLREVVPRLRGTLVGLAPPVSNAAGVAGTLGVSRAIGARHRSIGPETRVRHLIGIDPVRKAIAVAEQVSPGEVLTFCQRNVEAARRDLVRICSEIRDEIETRTESAAQAAPTGTAGTTEAGAPAEPPVAMLGAVYVSCSGRGGPHFGAPSAELQIVRRALGDVPLVGFFAAGEIARETLYGYTGVLTVFAGR
jgi:small ligand-binding sensory domain FIST